MAQDPTYNTTDQLPKLEGLHRKGLGRYYDGQFLEDYMSSLRQQKKGNDYSFKWYPRNAPGRWMSDNIKAPNTVMEMPATPESVAAELENGNYGYVVIPTYLGGYSTFRDISQMVRADYPEAKVVSAAVGALLPESTQYADHVVKGSQVHDLRKIIGENEDDPLKISVVRSDTETKFNGVTKHSSYGLLVSSYGCMYGCEFCPATAQFGTVYKTPFSAPEIAQAITDAHDRIAPQSDKFTLSIAEPQGMGKVKMWKEVLKLCRNLPFQCDLVSTTSSRVLEQFSLEELTEGALRLSTVNIGVESLLKGYKKNDGVDLKALIAKLQNGGINAVATFIVGLDWQNQQNVREEVKLLKDLDASGYIVANLEMQPNTPLYNQYKEAGRLPDTPPELLSFYGYQAFDHPAFNRGFNDMLPLLGEIEDELASGTRTFGANLGVFMNRNNARDIAVQQQIKNMTQQFQKSLDPRAYSDGGAEAVKRFSADLYYNLAFRQTDLFHPFILSTN